MRCTELINSETPDGLVWNQIMDETDAGKHLPKKPGSEVLGHGRRRSSLKHCEIFLSFHARARTWETLRSAASQCICGFLFCVQGHMPCPAVRGHPRSCMSHHMCVLARIHPASCWVPSHSPETGSSRRLAGPT